MSFRTVYGNDWSEAGWRMCNRDECVIASVPLEFIDTAPIRRGDPATILGAWMVWYDRNVEEITSPVWGWSATNDVADSNHLAGVALDINAPRYPWGARTMPRDRIHKVRRGLDLFEGFVFWGADWERADEMHYQLRYPEGDARTHGFAERLRAGHLGIYGNPPQEDDMALTPHQAAQLTDIQTQLRGPDLKGWPQLGKNDKGQNLTLVDAIAKLSAEVAELRKQQSS